MDFFKKIFIRLLSTCSKKTFGQSITANFESSTKCVSLNNLPHEAITILVNINSNDPLPYKFTVTVNRCSGSCNAIDDLCAQVCIPDKVKNMNIKLVRVDKIRFLVQHELCECK